MEKACAAGQLQFFGDLTPLRDPPAFARYLAPLRKRKWVVYAKAPFGGPQHVLEYLGRYIHRVAISNRRLLTLEDGQVSFEWKDYRDGQRQKVMTVSAEEFIRLFLQHTLPPGFKRIRYYGFLANCHRARKLHLCRQLLAVPARNSSRVLPITATFMPRSPAGISGVAPSAESEPCSRSKSCPLWTPHDAHRPEPATTPALLCRQRTPYLCPAPAKPHSTLLRNLESACPAHPTPTAPLLISSRQPPQSSPCYRKSHCRHRTKPIKDRPSRCGLAHCTVSSISRRSSTSRPPVSQRRESDETFISHGPVPLATGNDPLARVVAKPRIDKYVCPLFGV